MVAVCKNFNCSANDFWKQHGPGIKNFCFTAMKIAASVAICIYSPTAFAVGVAIGTVFHKELEGRINNFVELWNKNTLVKVGMVGLGVLTFFISLEFTAAWVGASWPVYLLSKK